MSEITKKYKRELKEKIKKQEEKQKLKEAWRYPSNYFNRGGEK